ncbi:protein of unknown function [Candidatus Methylomirabilis oxygeniifera]|uniref:Uncharacterized protein n=1 Tax=Methylomirabilis oxygeniifera TaxID=671143 RepID=D5MM71_METO1|nr:protein of unknown function [Candidatus Methylomirabilis oxyfera]
MSALNLRGFIPRGLPQVRHTGGPRIGVRGRRRNQRATLDSSVSGTGQACQARNDGLEQKTIPRSKLRGSSKGEGVRFGTEGSIACGWMEG